MASTKRVDPRMFSIELNSKDNVKRISMLKEEGDHFLIEGHLGELESLRLIENEMLEITGSSGILRTDLTENDLRKMLERRGADA